MGRLTEISSFTINDLKLKLAIIQAASTALPLEENIAYQTIHQLIQGWEKIKNPEAQKESKEQNAHNKHDDDVHDQQDEQLITLFEQAKNSLLRNYDAITNFFATCDGTVWAMLPMLLEALDAILDQAHLPVEKASQRYVFSDIAREQLRQSYILGDKNSLGLAPLSHKQTLKGVPSDLIQPRHLFFNPAEFRTKKPGQVLAVGTTMHVEPISKGATISSSSSTKTNSSTSTTTSVWPQMGNTNSVSNGAMTHNNFAHKTTGHANSAAGVNTNGAHDRGCRGEEGVLEGTRNHLFKQFNSCNLDVPTLKQLLACYVSDYSILQTLTALAGQGLMPALPGVVLRDKNNKEHEKMPSYNIFQWVQQIDLERNTVTVDEHHYVLYTEKTFPMQGYYMDPVQRQLVLGGLEQIQAIKGQNDTVNAFTPILSDEDQNTERNLIAELIALQSNKVEHAQRITEIKVQLQQFADKTRAMWREKLQTHHQLVPPLMQTHFEAEIIKNENNMSEVSFAVQQVEIALYHPSLTYRGPVDRRPNIRFSELGNSLRIVSMHPNGVQSNDNGLNSNASHAVLPDGVQQPHQPYGLSIIADAGAAALNVTGNVLVTLGTVVVNSLSFKS